MGRGQQRRDKRPDIVGHARATQRCLRRDESIHLRYVAQRPSAEIRFDSAWRDDIHGYFALTKFLREIAREHLDRTLYGSVYGKAGQSDPRKAARQVHDSATIGDDRQEVLRQEDALSQLRRPLIVHT